MENLVTRYRNVTILVAILFAQVLGLAIQVRRSSENQSSRLIRVWVVGAITPLEKCIVWSQGGISGIWHNYVYLRGVRQENRDLRDEIERLRLEQVRLTQDAQQAQRLQSLLGFREQFISQTMPAQVIGTSGSEQSRLIYIDKGARDGIGRIADDDADIDRDKDRGDKEKEKGRDKGKDMAVITSAGGVVGKVLYVNRSSSEVLLINDQSSGVGVILEKSRLQGVLKGTASGKVVLDKIMNDEKIELGEKVLTSGGDRIFPKGLLVGTVSEVSSGPESFLKITVKPAADLDRLEEVLVITKKVEQAPSVADEGPIRAVDILTDRLPSVPDKPPADSKPAAPGGTATTSPAAAAGVKAQLSGTHDAKPAGTPATTPKAPSKPAVVPTGMTTKPAASTIKTTNSTTKPAGTPAKAPPKTDSTRENNPQ
jgi:rod shape-determining protein MreC